MDRVLSSLKNLRVFLLIFISTLIFSLHYSFIYFINSSYISLYSGIQLIGAFYALGAIFNIALFFCVPQILKRLGNYRLALSLITLEILAVLGLSFFTYPPLVFLLFFISQALVPVIYYSFDIFLEKYSSAETVGGIRGIQLTMTNLPNIIAPFIVGLILARNSYQYIYLISSAFLIPLVVILFTYFRQFKDAEYVQVPLKATLKSFYANKNIFDVFLDNFLLNLFYGWMVIYMPIYLHEYIGFDWSSIGLILSIVMLPFMFIQIPLGKREDRLHTEKEFLTIGFTIMAVATIITAFIHEQSFVLWAAVLLTTRIGASMVEVSCESYFFKHIHPENSGFLSIFRINRTLPYLIFPIIAGICLFFLPFQYMFIVLGLIMLLGIRYAFQLER